MTTEECLKKIKSIEDDLTNHTLPGSLWLYTKSARTKMDKLRREIASNMRSERLARGDTVNDDGYSGRQTNRR